MSKREDDQDAWAWEVMAHCINEREAKALDLMGWKIVRKVDDGSKWPYDGNSKYGPCPDWCDDCSETKLRLRSISGGKGDDGQ